MTRAKEFTAHIRFRGGAVKTLTIPLQVAAWQQQVTPPEVMSEIDMLLDHHNDQEVADILNGRHIKSGAGKAFCSRIVSRLRREHGLKSRFERLRNRGLLTLPEIAQSLGVSGIRVKIWRNHGRLKAYAYNDRNECLYEPPGDNPPRKMQGKKMRFLSDANMLSRGTTEVQYET